MRIAVIGPYGLPAGYGGIERHAEEIYSRLVALGHEVTLYSRSSYSEFSGVYRGIRVVRVPVVRIAAWESVFYALGATLHALATGKYDVFHYHSLPSSSYAWLPRLARKRVLCTVHSIDWRHARWGRLASWALRWSEYAAVTYPHVTIAVSEALREDLISRHRDKPIIAIPNGVQPPAGIEPPELVEQMGLRAGEYLLFVGRLVPEKGPDVLLGAARLRPLTQVAVVGGSRYSDAYIDHLKAMAGDNVRFLGFRYGHELTALYTHAKAVVVSSMHEGFSMVSIEAMSHGRPVIASDIPALRERLEDRGYYFRPGDPESLAKAITALQDGRQEATQRGADGKRIALRDYGWDRIAQLTLSALETSPTPNAKSGDSGGASAHPETSR